MDAKVAGAGVAMALGMMLLLPTFNALNNSYVENVTPPPWIPPPDEIPEDFVPPEDWEPPPDWVPPEGWEPPPDWEPPEGWEPPPGYEGPIPPGGCPPPLIQWIEPSNSTFSMGNPTSGQQWDGSETFSFTAPKYTVGVEGSVNFSAGWQAQSVSSSLRTPDGDTLGPLTNQSNAGPLLFSPQQNPRTEQVHQIIAKDEASMPPSGRYTFTVSAQTPISGSFVPQLVVAIACGGMLS